MAVNITARYVAVVSAATAERGRRPAMLPSQCRDHNTDRYGIGVRPSFHGSSPSPHMGIHVECVDAAVR